jgi:hypothetical protein
MFGPDKPMRTILSLVVAALGALAVVAFVSTQRDLPVGVAPLTPEEENPPGWPPLYKSLPDPKLQALYGHLKWPMEHRLALEQAGLAIHAGKKPTEALSPAHLALVREVADSFRRVPCPHGEDACAGLRVDYLPCLDDAAAIIARRRKQITSVPKLLHRAAVAVAVTNTDRAFQNAASQVERCLRFAARVREDAGS